MGIELARECPIDADIVIPVPDSGVAAALGYSQESGIPFENGLLKNRYVGRTFIQPTQEMREVAVRLKLNANAGVLKGKRVIMIDDSIVRGTTSSRLVEMVRKAGATEVHLLISSPPVMYPCYYGIDTAEREKLIATQLDNEGIREYIGADTLHYLSSEGLLRALGKSSVCLACFSGDYPASVPPSERNGKLNLEMY
jgi:amidophosphoribosyltransferase